MDELVQVLGAPEVAQVVLAEVEEAGAVREPLRGERPGGRREQHLAAVPGRHDPGGAVHGGAEVVAAPLLGLPAVDAHPHPQRAGLAPRLGDQAALRGEARRRRVDRAGEDRHHPVAGRLDHRAAGSLDGVAQDRVVPAEGDLHAVRELLPQARAALQVGEQEGQGSGRGHLHVPIIGLQSPRRRSRTVVRWRPPSPRRFLIADISGYTGYLADVELDHAQDILADLIGTVVTALRPGFRLAKLEGDAAFTYAIGEKHRRVDAARHHRALLLRLPAAAARRPPGDLVRVQRLQPDPGPRPQVRRPPRPGDRPEGRRPAGAARIGRDRRPSAAQERRRRADSGSRPTPCSARPASTPRASIGAALGMRPHAETYERIGDVHAWVLDLERRWQEEETRARVFVTPEESTLTVSVPTTVPPQVAWEFLTTPGQRMSWQPWVTEVGVEGATGGRRGAGSANHCRHGKDAVVEEILDWRPYDYVTDRTILDTPQGPVKVLHTIELEPTTTGTTIHMRFGAPKTKRERELMAHIGPAYGAALESAIPSLVAQLEERCAARGRRRRSGTRAGRAATGRAARRPRAR